MPIDKKELVRDKKAFKKECDRRRALGLVLRGNTYPFRAEIDAQGGIWDARAKTWLVPDQETLERLQRLIESHDRPTGPARNVPPPEDAPDGSSLDVEDDTPLPGTQRVLPAPEQMPPEAALVPLSGNTYPIRAECAQVGGQLVTVNGKKTWAVPREHAARLQKLADDTPREARTPEQVLAQSGRKPSGDGKVRYFEATLGSGKFIHIKGNLVRVGQVIEEFGKKWLVVATEKPYYHTRDDCEDQDCFCRDYGWKHPYTALPVE